MSKTPDINIIPSGYLFTQSALLFLHYGLKYDLPLWVKWFPTLFAVIFVFIMICCIIIGAIIGD